MDGYPLVVVFGRGFFCPRDQEQMRQLVGCQSELAVTYGKLVTVSVDPPMVQAAFRAGLGAEWPFEQREVIKRINILDETEGEYAYVTRPYTFVLRPDLTIRKIYDSWFFVGIGPERMTVREICHLLYFDPKNLDGARKALCIRALSPGWRQSFEERLAKTGASIELSEEPLKEWNSCGPATQPREGGLDESYGHFPR